MLTDKPSVLILTHRDLNAGGGASYRTLNMARYLSALFRVYILDGRRNTFIVVYNGLTIRRKLKKSFVVTILSFIPSILSRVFMLFRFPSEEVGRLTATFNLGLLLDALRIGLWIKPAIILIEEYYSLAGVTSILKKILKAKALVVDLHNIDTYRLMRYPNISRIFVKLIRVVEALACKVSDLVIVVSKLDYAIAKYLFKHRHLNVIVVPNFVAYEVVERALEGLINVKELGRYVVYHGDFRYFPNREALLILLKHVMPEIWRDFPDIKLVLIGPGLPRFEGTKVISLGFLPQEELYAVITGAVCAIVPLLRGGGTRIKVLEYMACGIPVISTRVSAEGLEVESYKHIILINDVTEIPSAFKALINDIKLRNALVLNALNLVRSKYDGRKVIEELAISFNSLLERGF